MKKIILSLIALVACMSINAQVVKVYNTKTSTTEPVGAYTNCDYATIKVFFEELETKKGTTSDGHEWVDLGLPSGTMWATCNVGASEPEEYGNYYAWGETTTKTTAYSWTNYKYCDGTESSLNKYCTDSEYGTVDNKTELEAADDAATANWGESWCMPTYTQVQELYNSNYTTTTWTTQNGVYGRLITSKKNNKSIFLPAAGNRSDSSLDGAGSEGHYWSRTVDASDAFYLYFDSENIGKYMYDCRYLGNTVRPVIKNHDYVEIGGVKWATMNLGATTVGVQAATTWGDYYAWGETEPRYTNKTINNSDHGNTGTFTGWKANHSSGYDPYDPASYSGDTLDTDHDAATQNWGSGWRTPTRADFQALIKACTGSTTLPKPTKLSSSSPVGGIYWFGYLQTYLPEYTGTGGLLFVDQTDTSKRVFFPAAGSVYQTSYRGGATNGNYYTSDLYALKFYTTNYWQLNTTKGSQYQGFSIRPVVKE